MTSIAVKTLLSETTSVTYTPGYEGANIGTIIGFKHVNYLVEKAVIEHFRRCGLAVGALYESSGVGFDIIDVKTKLSAALLVDDDVDAVVTPTTGESGNVASFSVELTVQRDGAPKRAVRSKVQVQFRRDEDERRMTKRAPLPEGLDRFVVDRIGGSEPGDAITDAGAPLMSGASSDDDPVSRKLVEGRNAYAWRFKVPYPYIHFFERLQMSAYLRLMEEAKYRFVEARGCSIGGMLTERNWIPAVSANSVTIMDEVLMEEDLYIVYSVKDIFKNMLYTATMDCYVVRDGKLVQTATGEITHCYVMVENGKEAVMVPWDERVVTAFSSAPSQA
ncbi:thioesterase family protein [Saccharothrix sp. NRRL B-16314]|uniref:thioesterase family protein n=1 Tax=Saccharothrix sp. NRRL B-16314 TaxID=1463825 RepID=UPI0005269465|nr:thioesterase family protein [Saccharothrix sp. NRRL B-16314]